MKPAIDVIGKEMCMGCFACYNNCPFNAIKMKEDENGFYYPDINENCTYCGLCQKVCPIISPPSSEGSLREPGFYGGWSRDEDVRKNSSSGGIFSELARYIIESGGIVFGVAWDKNLSPVHIRVSNIGDVSRLRGSKYLQSYVGRAYKNVKLELSGGRTVLFSGTPCQIAGLRSYLRENENQSELVTVEVVCHGVPSSLIFKKYLDWVESKHRKKVVGINFRDKRDGWEKFRVAIKFEDNTEIYKYHPFNPFFRGYLQNLYLRQSCYDCPFSTIPRVADITLGDFWGAPPTIHDNRGVSVLIANTQKGDSLLKELEKLGRIVLIEIDKEVAIRGNPRITSGHYNIPPVRQTILREAQLLSFKELSTRYFRIPGTLEWKIRQFAGLIISKFLKKR